MPTSIRIAVLALALLVAGATALAAGGVLADEEANATVEGPSEPAYGAPVPEPGDPYFEAEADDGRWVSYVNPRDEYRDPYLGNGSGKLCVTLLNEAGEAIAGESVPNTTVTVPTGESIAWHSGADPIVVRYPLPDHYERPLDSDQFGTDPDHAQGDGYLDAHCIEFHGPAEDERIEYGPATVAGEGADRIEVVGYHQQAGSAWETDVDPVADAAAYGEDGVGSFTYEPGASHGQVIVVLQLTKPEEPVPNGSEDDRARDSDSGSSSDADSDSDPRTEDGAGDDGVPESNGSDDGSDPGTPTEERTTTEPADATGADDDGESAAGAAQAGEDESAPADAPIGVSMAVVGLVCALAALSVRFARRR